jgi:hypothetical protein
MTAIHHPSCPARCLEPSNCPDEVTGMPCNSCWSASCLCGPEAAAEDQLILQHRSVDAMLLDVIAHADAAVTKAWGPGPIARRMRAVSRKGVQA